MKKTLLILLATATLGIACTKEETVPETNNAGNNTNYPISYQFQSASNISAIRVFTHDAEIANQGYPCADSLENITASFINDETAELGGIILKLLNDNQAQYILGTDTGSLSYNRVGNLIYIGGLVLKPTSTGAVNSKYLSYSTKTVDGATHISQNQSTYSGADFASTIKESTPDGDTTAARSYDLVFKKL